MLGVIPCRHTTGSVVSAMCLGLAFLSAPLSHAPVDAFVLPPPSHFARSGRLPPLLQPAALAAFPTDTDTSPLATDDPATESPAPSSSTAQERYTTETDVAQAQAEAERLARSSHSSHDNFAMNALFVNVPERPAPTSCSTDPNDLPADLPPGCLLRIGPNGASRNEGFLDGDGLIHCITLPPRDGDGVNEGEDGMMYSATYVHTRGRALEQERRVSKDGANGDGADDKFSGTLGAAPRGLPMLGSLLRNGMTFGTLTVQKDTANTALAQSGGRVLALMEQSPPSEVEVTRDGRVHTVGSMCRLDGAVPPAPINGGSLGTHGRTDPTTGERVHVSYTSSDRPYVRVDTSTGGGT